jgi:hypothetical protein
MAMEPVLKVALGSAPFTVFLGAGGVCGGSGEALQVVTVRRFRWWPRRVAGAPPPSPASASALAAPPSSQTSAPRAYSKGNWILQETLILITSRHLDDDHRAGGGTHHGHGCPPRRGRPQRRGWRSRP